MSAEPEDEAPTPKASGAHAAALSLLVVVGFGSPTSFLIVAPLFGLARALGVVAGLGALAALAWAFVETYRHIRRRGPEGVQALADLLVFVLLPAWGLFYAFAFGERTCVDDQCGGVKAFRPFATPQIVGLVGLAALVTLAYCVSRRRSEALRPFAELTLLSTLIVGTLAHAVLAVHFGEWMVWGLVFPPLFLPCLAPALTVVLLTAELVRRLRLRGRDAELARMTEPRQVVYREGERPLPEVPLVLHRGLFARALAFSPVLLGMYFAIHAAWLGRPWAAVEVLTRTCGYTLSRIPIEVVPADCHYLCTVAARGHGWLVRPERMGVRRGIPILVNRQLAIANAFEDLLHERWPRFGRVARRVYDALGLPVSRYIRGRWLADAIYLAMKPAEWVFYLTLLLLDQRSPEARIDRMYR